jgi:hypothetical protein
MREHAPRDVDFDAFVHAPHPEPVRRAIARHRAGLDAWASASSTAGCS